MVSEKHGLNQVPKELPSRWSKKANTHGHGMGNAGQYMFSTVFGERKGRCPWLGKAENAAEGWGFALGLEEWQQLNK